MKGNGVAGKWDGNGVGKAMKVRKKEKKEKGKERMNQKGKVKS